MLKIPIVHADSVSKSLRQKMFFSRERPLSARGKIIYFATIMDTNRDSAYQSQNKDKTKTEQFSNLFPWARVLKWGRKREKQRKRRLGISAVTIRFTSLNISLTANNHFWYCCPFFASDLMHNSTGYVIKQLVYAFSCALSSYGARGKFGEHLRLLPRATLTLLSCSPNFPRAP